MGLKELGTDGIIERQAGLWGEKRFRGALEGGGKRGAVVRVVDCETSRGALRLPKLVEKDRRDNSLRFDWISGAVYLPSWHELPVSSDGQRRFLAEAENYCDLGSKWRKKEVDLENLPNCPIQELRMAKCPDIQTAIRQARHIREAFSIGDEAEQLEVIWREINNAWTSVLTGKVTEEKLGVLASETASVLRQNGLTTAEKQAKTNINERLSLVFQKDKLGRLNSLVQRIRLRSAYLSAIGLEAFSVLVRAKYTEVEGVLMMEDEISRQAITDARNALNTVMGFDRRGAWVFEGGRPREGEPKGLEMALYGVVLLTNRGRVAPYLPVTRAAGIALWGCRPKYKELNLAVIGEEAATTLLDENFLSVRSLLEKGDFLTAKELAKKWVFDPLGGLVQ